MRTETSKLRWHMPLVVAFEAGTLNCEINDRIEVGAEDLFEAFSVGSATRMSADSFELRKHIPLMTIFEVGP
jgi:hypothetical protein